MTEEKKFSFGFSKLKAPSKLIKPAIPSSSKAKPSTLQFIDCLENQSIKVKKEVIENKKELVIPLKAINVAKRIVNVKKEPQDSNEVKQKIDTEDGIIGNSTPLVKIKEEIVDKVEERNSIDAQARREILESLTKGDDGTETRIFSLPLTTNAPTEGEKESTLDDYENIPIEQFGMAMLRGMGWKPDDSKNKNKPMDVILRPKGLGLGADKSGAIGGSVTKANCEDNKLIKNCCVKVTGGMYKNRYGKVESFNEDSGRVVVKLAMGEHVTVSETLLLRVTQDDYDKNSRVINMQKYEEYKEQDSKQFTTEEKVERTVKCRDSSNDERNERRNRGRKEHSTQNESNSDSDGHKKNENYNRRENNDRLRKNNASISKDQKRSRRYSDDESDDRSCHYRNEKYKSRNSKNIKSSRDKRDLSESEDERDKRKSQKESDRYLRNDRERMYSRDSASTDEDKNKKNSKSEKHNVEQKRYDNREKAERKKGDRKERNRSKKRRYSSLDSESSSDSEDVKRKKKYKNQSSSSEDERRNKKKKKDKKSKCR